MKYVKNPCYHCPDRKHKCHSVCDKYKEFSEGIRMNKENPPEIREKHQKDIERIRKDIQREKESRSKTRD